MVNIETDTGRHKGPGMVSISARGGGEHNATGAEPWINTNGRTGLVGKAKKKCPQFCATAKQKPRQLPPAEAQKPTQGTSTSKGNVSRCNTAAPRKKPPPPKRQQQRTWKRDTQLNHNPPHSTLRPGNQARAKQTGHAVKPDSPVSS